MVAMFRMDLERMWKSKSPYICLAFLILFFYFVSNNLFTLANFTQTVNICAANSNSSKGGKLGAIRILLSFGSFPYGKVAPALVITTPASFIMQI